MSTQNEPAQSTELVAVQNAVTKMDRVSAGIAELTRKFGGVIFEVKTPKGMAEAKAARREIAAPRIEVEKIRKEAKAPILELGRKLDAEAKRIANYRPSFDEIVAFLAAKFGKSPDVVRTWIAEKKGVSKAA